MSTFDFENKITYRGRRWGEEDGKGKDGGKVIVMVRVRVRGIDIEAYVRWVGVAVG